jgi:hypothetical protein
MMVDPRQVVERLAVSETRRGTTQRNYEAIAAKTRRSKDTVCDLTELATVFVGTKYK